MKEVLYLKKVLIISMVLSFLAMVLEFIRTVTTEEQVGTGLTLIVVFFPRIQVSAHFCVESVYQMQLAKIMAKSKKESSFVTTLMTKNTDKFKSLAESRINK